MSREAFGPTLRRVRLQRQISIEEISHTTRVPAELLEGLERNDFSGWPIGLFARAYVRQYAIAIGADADETVNEFCRWYPEGERRAERLVRERAEIAGHDLVWQDDVPASGERRGVSEGPAARPSASPSPLAALFIRVRRAFDKA